MSAERMTGTAQGRLAFGDRTRLEVPGHDPLYRTDLGEAYLGDSLKLMKAIPSASINVVLTSPPYALHFKKEYGNADQSDYVAWFLDFAREMFRILRDDGSLILNIGGSYNPGTPTRSLYHYKLLIALVDQVGFSLAQECFWYNPAKMPVPAEWVTVRRIRLRDSVEYVWWLSKTAWPKANNRTVLRPYSKDMVRLNQKGLNATVRPSGHSITTNFSDVAAGGSIPPNVIEEEVATDLLRVGNNSANDSYTKRCKAAGLKIHPARFPAALPDFFLKLTTNEGDLVLDPFAGSNTTGAVAESLDLRWIAVDRVAEYLEASRFRFFSAESSSTKTDAVMDKDRENVPIFDLDSFEIATIPPEKGPFWTGFWRCLKCGHEGKIDEQEMKNSHESTWGAARGAAATHANVCSHQKETPDPRRREPTR